MSRGSFYMYVVSLVLNPQHQHHDRFYQSLVEYQEISPHIQELTNFSSSYGVDPNVIVSCPYP